VAKEVHDSVSNNPETLEHFADVLRASSNRRAVFEAIYGGRRDKKSVSDIMDITNLGQEAVLKAGLALDRNHMVERDKGPNRDGSRQETAYKRTRFCSQNRDKILRLVDNPKRAKALPTKRRPANGGFKIGNIKLPTKSFAAKQITIDDIDSFKRVRNVRGAASSLPDISETKFKNGVRDIIGETATFKDWGGEKSDLMSTRLRLNGKRRAAAFAFKGPGQKGVLVPAKMGKNGDQCQRLFQESAEVFVIQHWREIATSVHELVATFAKVKSIAEGKTIYYCIIDGQDSGRLVRAYPQYFR